MSSLKNCPRERCSQARYAVTGSSGAVQPIGHPITISWKRGLEVRPACKQSLPFLKLSRAGGIDRDVADRADQPSARSTCQSAVHVLAAFVSEYWPWLPSAMSVGDDSRIEPSSISRSGTYPASQAVGVGQNEEAATPVASARFSRCEQACLWREAHASKVCRDLGVSQRQVPLDVLAPDPFRVHFLDDARDLRPEMPGIVGAGAVARIAEWLAGIAGSDEMNAAAPSSAVKGSKVVPDRRLTQGLVRHPRHESGRRVALPLDESHSSVGGLCDVQAEVEAAIAGAKRDAPEVARFRDEAGR